MSSSPAPRPASGEELHAALATTSTARRQKKRRRPQIEAWLIDREAVRSVISEAAYLELERLRAGQAPEEADERFFWQAARQKMVQMAQARPDAAQKLTKAKIGAVGAMLGIPHGQIAQLLQQADLPRFIDAALSNDTIRKFQRDAGLRGLWTENGIRANPPMRVEFEHAVVLGAIHDAGDIAKSKNWGRLVALEPLRPDDWLYPRYITYQLKATSKLRLRWEFRDTFKHVLGNKRGLVNDAMRESKRRFAASLSEPDARVLRDKLGISPDEFWQRVRHGERYGPDGIVSFLHSLEEKTKGYFLPFPEPDAKLVQIDVSGQSRRS